MIKFKITVYNKMIQLNKIKNEKKIKIHLFQMIKFKIKVNNKMIYK